MTTNKTWWAPVWRGLVVDPEGKHHRRIKNAVWLFLYLILHADRRTGKLKRKLKTTASEMGIPQKTIQRWLKTLKDQGYIETKNTGRCLEIVINLWKNTQENPRLKDQSGRMWQIRRIKTEEPRGTWMAAKPFGFKPK